MESQSCVAVSERRIMLVVALGSVLLACVAAQSADVPPDMSGFDHRAHAVPGGPYVGSAPVGETADVMLDGTRSHSHYFNGDTGLTGAIVTYEWTSSAHSAAEVQAACSNSSTCTLAFPHGDHSVLLKVIDNTESVAYGQTTVTVGDTLVSGLRAWYYVADANGILTNTPVYSDNTPAPGKRESLIPSDFYGGKARVEYFGQLYVDQPGTYRLRLSSGEGPDGNGAGGYVSAKVGDHLQVEGPDGLSDSNPWELVATDPLNGAAPLSFYATSIRNVAGPGDYFVLQWSRDGADFVDVPDSAFKHLPNSFAPVVNSASSGTATTGSVLTLTGTAFKNNPVVVLFGPDETPCTSLEVQSDEQLTCVVPSLQSGNVQFFVRTSSGESNRLTLAVGGASDNGVGYYQVPEFYNSFFTDPNAEQEGTPYKIDQVATGAVGPDGRYYFGSLGGHVHALEVDSQYRVLSHCTSQHLGEDVSVLGIGFNPSEYPAVRVYVSVSLLYWAERHGKPREEAWRNGRIVTLVPDTNGHCLGVESTVVTGLPVSNHDHGPNAIHFDTFGAMYVSVGGSTNGGRIENGQTLGAAPDSPLSGAILKLPVGEPGFDGNIQYTKPEDPATTDVASGDVAVHAAGLRNCFSFVLHTNEQMYAVDNGPNEGFGVFSDGCEEDQTRPSKHDGDPLRRIQPGGFHGYANMNRGRYDARQCVQRTLDYPSSADGYEAQLTWFESATTGLTEYTSNTFGGSMRTNLIASKFAINGPGKAYRVVLSADGNSVSSKFEMAAFSGLSALQTPYGGIAMPRVWQGHIAVLAAKEQDPGIVTVSAVTPMRGPRGGGNRVLITGWNFKGPLTVTFGGFPCTEVGDVAADGRSLRCNVPPAADWVRKVPVVVDAAGGVSGSWGWEYWYQDA